MWLSALGARLTGFSVPPSTDPSLFSPCAKCRCNDRYADIVDQALIDRTLTDSEPEIVIHMAAQALWYGRLMQTPRHIRCECHGDRQSAAAARSVPSVRAVTVMTSDKVYRNDGAGRPFSEDDRLGGHDPYSSSKACAELVTDSFRRCFFADRCPIATARSGNVIGGGDWSPFRVLPDVVAALRPAGRWRCAIRRRCGLGSTCSIH